MQSQRYSHDPGRIISFCPGRNDEYVIQNSQYKSILRAFLTGDFGSFFPWETVRMWVHVAGGHLFFFLKKSSALRVNITVPRSFCPKSSYVLSCKPSEIWSLIIQILSRRMPHSDFPVFFFHIFIFKRISDDSVVSELDEIKTGSREIT